jgi:alpha-1,2-mannosyltransferase
MVWILNQKSGQVNQRGKNRLLPSEKRFFILGQNDERAGASRMKPWFLRPSLIVLFALTALTALIDPLHRGLRGAYFLGPDISKEPNLTTREKKIGPDRLRLEYPNRTGGTTILWRGGLYIAAAGEYEFELTSSPHSEFRLDEKIWISSPAEGLEARTVKINLEKGFHPIQLLFSQVRVRDGFNFRWAPPGRPLGTSESAPLFAEAHRSAASLAIFRVRRILLPPLLAACLLILFMFLTGSERFLAAGGTELSPIRGRETELKLLAFLLLNSFALNVLLSLFSETTVLDFSRFFVVSPVHSGEDSWKQMAKALDYLSSPHERTLYAEVFFAQKNKFQYPPTSLLFLEPLRWLPFSKMVRAANFISWLAVIASALFLALILRQGLGRAPTQARSVRSGPAILWLAGFGFTLTFYPLIKSFEVGQIQTWLYFLFILALWSWLSDKKFLAGVLIGFICLIKPQLGLFALWGMLRREDRFTVGIVGTAGTFGVLSICLFGWANHLDYLRALAYMGKHGESYYTNQSVNGLVNRLLFNGTNLHGNPHAFAPYNAWVYGLTLISTAALIAAALFWKRGRSRAVPTEDFLIAAVAFTVASPIAWEHHYAILLPVFAAALPRALAFSRKPCRLTILAVAFALTANIFPPVNSLANTRLNFLQSHLFFGALALFGLLYKLRNEQRKEPKKPGPRSDP